MGQWQPDVLGDGYEQLRIPLGDDPDGQGVVESVLVRRVVRDDETVRAAVLYVHGFSDYFFQRELADFFAERGFAFHAVDLRKSGRSRAPEHTAHYVTDLALHEVELDEALAIVRASYPEAPVLLVSHSTGGLVVPLWVDHLNRRPGGAAAAGISGMVLNSPWFDLQLPTWQRLIATALVRALSHVVPGRVIALPAGSYGASLHVDSGGEWTYDLDMKPLDGCPVTYGWLAAVRRGQARLHRGLSIGLPVLVLHSTASRYVAGPADADVADVVLDVRQIARWSSSLGTDVTTVPVPHARHDVFLSSPAVRAEAYAAVDVWLRSRRLVDVRTDR